MAPLSVGPASSRALRQQARLGSASWLGVLARPLWLSAGSRRGVCPAGLRSPVISGSVYQPRAPTRHRVNHLKRPQNTGPHHVMTCHWRALQARLSPPPWRHDTSRHRRALQARLSPPPWRHDTSRHRRALQARPARPPPCHVTARPPAGLCAGRLVMAWCHGLAPPLHSALFPYRIPAPDWPPERPVHTAGRHPPRRHRPP